MLLASREGGRGWGVEGVGGGGVGRGGFGGVGVQWEMSADTACF